jgi:tetratricopeptide (TPR) repeat protein
MLSPDIVNLDPQHFVFWHPPAGYVIQVGSGPQSVQLPQVPLPLKIRSNGDGAPSVNAIGEGAYDYLRQFPDCPYNTEYVALLSQAYSHFLADLAAHVVMLDVKDVEPAYVFRKLTYLKILRLLEPTNTGLLWQLSQGFFNLALTFNELPAVRRHLLEAMRFGQDLLKVKPKDPAALNLLAEIDILFGDYPGAVTKLQQVLQVVNDQAAAARIECRLETCLERGIPDHPLLDDLECIGEALRLYAGEEYRLATELLERLEQDGYFMSELKSADFLCLLGMCRIGSGDPGGAFDALSQALEMQPDHQQAREALDSL